MYFPLDETILGRVGVVCLTLATIVFSTSTSLKAQTDGTRLLLEAYPLPEPESGEEAAPGPRNPPQKSTTRVSRDPAEPAELPSGLDIGSQRERIEQLRREQGEYSLALLAPLTALGEALQAEQAHQEALAVFDQAAYISRMHNGLEHGGDIPLLSAMIESHLALGEHKQMADRQAQLMYVGSRAESLDRADRAGLSEQMGDWRMEAFWAALDTEPEPVIRISFNAGADARATEPPADSRRAGFRNLSRARMHFLRGIRMLTDSKGWGYPDLMDLEYKYIRTLFLGGYREGLLDDPDFFPTQRRQHTGSRIMQPGLSRHSPVYFNGRRAWQRLLNHQLAAEQTGLHGVTEVLLALADWDLWFHHNGRAAETYAAAYELLREQDISEAALERLFNPAVPQRLPVFLAQPFSRQQYGLAVDEPVEYQGHVDVRYRLSRYGRVSAIRVTGGEGEGRDAVESRLRKMLKSYPARPRVRAGQVRSSLVEERYYFAWLESEGLESRR